MQVTTIGLDLAKNVFQVHGLTEDEEVVFNRPLRRAQLLPFFSKIEPCLIGAVLHGSPAARNAPNRRRISGGAFEFGAAKFGHPVEYANANFGFRFLVFEATRL